jgi:TPR repeat protein
MPVMATILVTTAAALAGVDRRTVRRWLGDGDIDLAALLEKAGLRLSAAEAQTVLEADAGGADACAELAQLFAERGLHSRAVEWWQKAADKNHADAMHWLARAYLDGRGVAPDLFAGLMWLAKSATLGHAVSQAQTRALVNRR